LLAVCFGLSIALITVWVSPAYHAPHAEGHELSIFGVRLGEALLALATFLLWLATRELVKGSDKTAERQLRAYVSIKDIEVEQRYFASGDSANEQIERQPHSLRLNALLENTGQTPTRKTLINLNYGCFPTGMPADFEFPSGKRTESANIGSRGTYKSPYVLVPLAEITKVVGEGYRIYVWGWVEYNDVFDNSPRHRTEFCFELEYIFDPQTDESVLHLMAQQKFSGSDADCMREASPYVPSAGRTNENLLSG
jgi:hypothetical protein